MASQAQNGKQLPAITVGWDFESQTPHVVVDGSFKSHDMAISVLERAVDHLKFELNLKRAASLQQAHAQQAQAEAIRRNLKM